MHFRGVFLACFTELLLQFLDEGIDWFWLGVRGDWMHGLGIHGKCFKEAFWNAEAWYVLSGVERGEVVLRVWQRGKFGVDRTKRSKPYHRVS